MSHDESHGESRDESHDQCDCPCDCPNVDAISLMISVIVRCNSLTYQKLFRHEPEGEREAGSRRRNLSS